MNQEWFEDMMSQKYHEDICFNPSKLLLLQFIVKDNVIYERYKVFDFQTYLYRVYSDNPSIAKRHPSYLVREIEKYGVKDLEDIARDTIASWMRDSTNGILRAGEKYFALDVDLLDSEDIVKKTSRLAKMMYKKIFGGDIPDVISIDDEVLSSDDKDLDVFGRSRYRNRVLEDMQYCPICEEIQSGKLFCVHIYEKDMGASDEELIDKDNGLILCRSHAESFFLNEFYFDEMGFAKKLDQCDIEPGMHLSFAIKNHRRKEYLKKRVQWLIDKGKVSR